MGILRSYFLFSWLFFFRLSRFLRISLAPSLSICFRRHCILWSLGFSTYLAHLSRKLKYAYLILFIQHQSVCMSVSKFLDLFPKTTSISTRQGYIIANYSWVSGFKIKLFKIKRHDPPKRVLVWRRKLKNYFFRMTRLQERTLFKSLYIFLKNCSDFLQNSCRHLISWGRGGGGYL